MKTSCSDYHYITPCLELQMFSLSARALLQIWQVSLGNLLNVNRMLNGLLGKHSKRAGLT